MMTGIRKTSCFDRWVAKNPGGTYEQFMNAQKKFRDGKNFGPPKLTSLPDGTMTSTDGMTPSERADVAHEHSKTAATNQ